MIKIEFECGCEIDIKDKKTFTKKSLGFQNTTACVEHKTRVKQYVLLCDQCGKKQEITRHQLMKKFCDDCTSVRHIAECRRSYEKNIHRKTYHFSCGCSLKKSETVNAQGEKEFKKFQSPHCPVHMTIATRTTTKCHGCGIEYHVRGTSKFCENCRQTRRRKKKPEENKIAIKLLKRKEDCQFYSDCLTAAAISNKRNLPCKKCEKYKKNEIRDVLMIAAETTEFDFVRQCQPF